MPVIRATLSADIGAGTAICCEMKAFGAGRTLRAEITEPEPGRCLVQMDPSSGFVTRFTVQPDAEATKATRSVHVAGSREQDLAGTPGIAPIMKAWLATPVTRAEAIGWALTFPVLMTILDAAVRVHVSLELIELAGGPREDLMSPALKVYQDIGQSGFVVLFCACALLPLLALITRQQPWVRVAAPLLCGLLAFSMWSQVRTAISDYQAAEATNVGDERKPSWLDEEPDLTGIDAEADDPRDPLDPDSEAEPASPR